MKPQIYALNEHGVAMHPTTVFEKLGKKLQRVSVRVASNDGYFWAVGISYSLSDRGMGSPVSYFVFTSMEQATQVGLHEFVRRMRMEQDYKDLTKLDQVFVKDSLSVVVPMLRPELLAKDFSILQAIL